MRIFLIFLAFIASMTVGAVAAYSEAGLRLFRIEAQRILPDGQGYYKMRIEQRVIVRVPRHRPRPASRRTMGKMSRSKVEYKERKIGKCLIMNRFVASRPGKGSKENLELITREGQLIRVYLGKGCLAREFYAGAYMERPKDGKLCAGRDMIHARTGAKCEIDKFRLLVARR